MNLLKRLIRKIGALTSIILIITLLSSGIVYAAWEFDFPIALQDTTGSARTYYPVMFGFGGQSLIDAGKINANALDTNVQIGSTDIKFMISSDNVTAVIPSLPAGGVVTVNFYTGYTPNQTTFPIITGDGGYVTVVDADNPTLRLGDEFAVYQKGWVNTDAGANKYMAIKTNAFEFEVSAGGTVTATIDPAGAPVSVSKAGLVSAEYDFVISADGTNLYLWVDSGAGFVLEDTSALGGSSVPANANGWILGQNNVMPYIEYFKIWVR